MKKYNIFVPIYNWTIDIVFDIDMSKDKNEFTEILTPMEPTELGRAKVFDALGEGKFDFGDTYADTLSRKMLIIFGKPSSFDYMMANKQHEMKHCIDVIVKTHELDLEAGAYLNGWYEVALVKSGFWVDWYKQYKDELIKLLG